MNYDFKSSVIGSVILQILAYLSPIGNTMMVMSVAFFMNFMVGLITSIAIQKESWSSRKAFRFILEAFYITGVISFTFSIGERLGNKDVILELIKIISYYVIWFYAQNIAKNFTRIIPESSICRFLHYAISLEFVKKLPLISQFNKYDKKNYLKNINSDDK